MPVLRFGNILISSKDENKRNVTLLTTLGKKEKKKAFLICYSTSWQVPSLLTYQLSRRTCPLLLTRHSCDFFPKNMLLIAYVAKNI